jgi:superfamily II DNA or RNA helicase
MKEVTKLPDGTLSVKFSFPKSERKEFDDTLEAVRSLPNRSWKSKEGHWKVSLDAESIAILKEAGFSIPKEIITESNKLEEAVKEKKKEIASVKIKNSLLYVWQEEHAKQIIRSIIENDSALDGSDTGAGKTFVALQVAKHFNSIPIVLTKKRAIPAWEKAAKIFGFQVIFVTNYEQYKFEKTEFLRKEKIVYEKGKKKKKDPEYKWIWNTNWQHMIIFDEAHSCKNEKTANAEMMRGVIGTGSKVLALSATIGDNPLHLYSVGLLLKLFKDVPSYWRWCYSRGVKKKHFGVEFINTEANLQKIHKDIFPSKGSRIAINALPPGTFPENLYITDPLDMGENTGKIQRAYDEMNKEIMGLADVRSKDKSTSILTTILRARQEIELLKVPTMVSLAEDLVEEGASVAIFVNFTETLSALSAKLKCTCIIDGSTKYEKCIENMEAFQADKERIIICNIKSGGVAISLHDLNGKHRRESIICPPQSAQDLIQTFGRIHRAGALTHAIQRLMYAKETVEEDVAVKVATKINNIRQINDGCLATKFELSAFKTEED